MVLSITDFSCLCSRLSLSMFLMCKPHVCCCFIRIVFTRTIISDIKWPTLTEGLTDPNPHAATVYWKAVLLLLTRKQSSQMPQAPELCVSTSKKEASMPLPLVCPQGIHYSWRLHTDRLSSHCPNNQGYS